MLVGRIVSLFTCFSSFSHFLNFSLVSLFKNKSPIIPSTFEVNSTPQLNFNLPISNFSRSIEIKSSVIILLLSYKGYKSKFTRFRCISIKMSFSVRDVKILITFSITLTASIVFELVERFRFLSR